MELVQMWARTHLIPGEDSRVQGTLKAIKSYRESCANPAPKEGSIFITLGSKQISGVAGRPSYPELSKYIYVLNRRVKLSRFGGCL